VEATAGAYAGPGDVCWKSSAFRVDFPRTSNRGMDMSGQKSIIRFKDEVLDWPIKIKQIAFILTLSYLTYCKLAWRTYKMHLNLLDYECIREGKSKTNIDKYDIGTNVMITRKRANKQQGKTNPLKNHRKTMENNSFESTVEVMMI
jgi:hypothetical protein